MFRPLAREVATMAQSLSQARKRGGSEARTARSRRIPVDSDRLAVQVQIACRVRDSLLSLIASPTSISDAEDPSK